VLAIDAARRGRSGCQRTAGDAGTLAVMARERSAFRVADSSKTSPWSVGRCASVPRVRYQVASSAGRWDHGHARNVDLVRRGVFLDPTGERKAARVSATAS